MDAGTVDYRALLEQEQRSLRAQLAEIGRGDPGTAGLTYDSNFADTSQVTAERGEVEVLAVQLNEALAEVERALGKLAAGSYGVCERCGRAISPARLEAMPACAVCIDCANGRR
jgi:DnaK suppressor protein